LGSLGQFNKVDVLELVRGHERYIYGDPRNNNILRNNRSITKKENSPEKATTTRKKGQTS